MSTLDPAVQPGVPGALPKPKKPLSCVSCKMRKLKCDHEKPICTRCAKNSSECVYPESRRRPTFQRSNVQELEARLAQVEGYLKEAGKGGREVDKINLDVHQTGEDGHKAQEDAASAIQNHGTVLHEQTTVLHNFVTHDETFDQNIIDDNIAYESQLPFEEPDHDHQTANTFGNDQLIALGMSEALPPSEVIEELHESFFTTQYHYMPAIHSGRYYQAYHGGPLRKPPMCLQYAIWALGALWHPKYDHCADVFYKRARQYAETDEMKGDGEHFITIPHAQAWALITCYEARAMLYTRASMSGARCSRLVQMLALDKLDGPDDNFPATLGPPRDWTELEERRRVFWVAFSCEAQGSIATGWPSLINFEDIMTRLPASEEAFASGQEETSPYLDEVLKGAPYGGFSGSIILNQILKTIMSHVHLIKPSDGPEDVMHGEFWKRHRRLDNQLSSLFMFMPESFRLPDNIRDPLATYINLNFHASVICLHHIALEVIEKHSLKDSLRKDSRCLLKNAAEEIVSIVKMTSHRSSLFSNPLCAFSLYCATTVYVYLAKEDPSSRINPTDMSNLELVINAMEAMGRIHMITCAFLQQACLDIDKNGLSSSIKLPNLHQYRNLFGGPASFIPLLARVSVSKHTQMSSPLPGRLPLDKPLGHMRPMNLRMTKAIPLLTGVTARMDRLALTDSFRPALGAISRNLAPRPTENIHKRKREYPDSQFNITLDENPFGSAVLGGHVDRGDAVGVDATHSSAVRAGSQNGERAMIRDSIEEFMTPDRTNSPYFSTLSPSQATSNASHALPSEGLRGIPQQNEAGPQQFPNGTPMRPWQPMDEDIFAFTEEINFPTNIAHLSGDPLDYLFPNFSSR
ncbi:binuclear zinc transcription factor [Trichoderma arundinaceum]|uniref:Binuclear zinc transcription factor n=1 Tax=Trichoderma arundinaceum TaxID=490622 RepID=A0A395NW93_TRIAR|nr:binuclear zinc transcription factor [Trichoderma arundinaceum]